MPRSGSHLFPEILIEERAGFGNPDQAMQVGTGDAQAAGSQGLIPIVLSNGCYGQFHLIVAKLPFKGACRMVVADVDNVVNVGNLILLEDKT
jgi:hypothetical protein